MNTVYTSCLSSRKTSSKPPELEAEAAPPPLRRPRPPPGRRASRARVSGIPSSDRWSRAVFAEVAADTELLSYGRWDGACLRATCHVSRVLLCSLSGGLLHDPLLYSFKTNIYKHCAVTRSSTAPATCLRATVQRQSITQPSVVMPFLCRTH